MSSFPPSPPGGLLRYLAIHLAFGVAAGVLFSAVAIGTNGWLWGVVFGSSDPVLAIAMITVANALTFGSLAMGASIMLLPLERDR